MSAALFALLRVIFAFVVLVNFAMSHGEDWSPGYFAVVLLLRAMICGVRAGGRGRSAILTEGVGCPTGREADGAKEVRKMEGLTKMLVRWSPRFGYAIGVLTIALPARALAAVAGGGTLPWDAPLTTLQNDLQGPVAHAVTTAAIIGTGIMWSVSEHGTGVRKLSAVAFGGAAALGATTLMTTLFPLGGALF